MRFILAAVDIQGGRDRRFVVQMIGYGEHLESWIIDRFNIRHLDADDDSIRLDMSTHVEHWDVLIHQVIDRTYPWPTAAADTCPSTSPSATPAAKTA